MSDTSQGPGWWKASDAKWYPPPPPYPSSSSRTDWIPPAKSHADDGLGCAGMIGVIATIIVMIIFAPLILFVIGWGFIIGMIISVAALVVGLVIWLVTGKDPME